MKQLVFILLLITNLLISSSSIVNITKDIEYVDVVSASSTIKIHRINDTSNKLSDDFTKTSRVCPPFCIQPITPIKGVKTVEELELIDFIKNRVSKHKGILIDARTKEWFNAETIPSAINIPFTLTLTKDIRVIKKIFKLFGANESKDGSLDFSNAKDLALFCNGIWCAQSPIFIKNIVKYGYPKSKIFYYRSGMQGWKLLGLTTSISGKEEVK